MEDLVRKNFQTIFHEQPAFIVRAPGRVNLIGEHTDYNDGFVLPMAIDRAVWIALRPRADRQVLVHAINFNDIASFSLDNLVYHDRSWIEYFKGVAWALQKAGFSLCGWEGVIAGDIPIGAGLSSSAATEIAVERAFVAVSGLEWDSIQMAQIGQRAENLWVGVNCGIMDQISSALEQAGHALLLDCRSLEISHIPLPSDIAVVVLDTTTRRGLVGSAYNERRAQCETASHLLAIRALRDITLSQFEKRSYSLDPLIRRRARHVITENTRVIQMVNALRSKDTESIGRLLYASSLSERVVFLRNKKPKRLETAIESLGIW